MSPSQIVKSAYPAGFPGSLKDFARAVLADRNYNPEVRDACKTWLANKAAQRQQARQCARSARRGHVVVHEQQHARSVVNSLAGSMPMRGGHS